MELRGSPLLAMFGVGLAVMFTGGWLLWSSQSAVDAGASWEDSPEWWAGDIRVGSGRQGRRTMNDGVVIMDSNSEHWNVGMVLAGLGALVVLGGGVASMGLSGTPFSGSSDDVPR